MTAPTDALRAECEKALREWWISPDASKAIPIPGLGPPRMVDAAFRAGFNVLAAQLAQREAEVANLRAALCLFATNELPQEQPCFCPPGWASTIHSRSCDAARAALANRPEGE